MSVTEVSMGPARVDIAGLVEGDSWTLSFSLATGGVPYNLTGLTIVSCIRCGKTDYPITVNVTSAINGQLILSQMAAPLVSGASWALRVGTRTMVQGGISTQPKVLP